MGIVGLLALLGGFALFSSACSKDDTYPDQDENLGTADHDAGMFQSDVYDVYIDMRDPDVSHSSDTSVVDRDASSTDHDRIDIPEYEAEKERLLPINPEVNNPLSERIYPQNLQNAINRAQPGSILYLHSDTYLSSIVDQGPYRSDYRIPDHKQISIVGAPASEGGTSFDNYIGLTGLTFFYIGEHAQVHLSNITFVGGSHDQFSIILGQNALLQGGRLVFESPRGLILQSDVNSHIELFDVQVKGGRVPELETAEFNFLDQTNATIYFLSITDFQQSFATFTVQDASALKFYACEIKNIHTTNGIINFTGAFHYFYAEHCAIENNSYRFNHQSSTSFANLEANTEFEVINSRWRNNDGSLVTKSGQRFNIPNSERNPELNLNIACLEETPTDQVCEFSEIE